MRQQIDLNGTWEWQIPGGAWQPREVPGSYRCVGAAIYRRSFELPMLQQKQRAFLCFEGITFAAQARLNGIALGELGPFTPYEFEIGGAAREGGNTLEVELTDIPAPYGPVIGWEAYAGIIRGVHIELRPANYISDCFWQCTLSSGCSHARAEVMLAVSGGRRAPLELRVELCDGAELTTQAAVELPPAAGESQAQLAFELEHPRLWSPDAPNLYTLTVSLLRDGEMVDRVVRRVGVREFRAEGTRFVLNGSEIVLHGVCRHDMWGEEQGHTLSRAQIEQDLGLIKELGANFVRLVHYPHDAYVVEVADRLGLMVSGEPLSWQSDFSDERFAAGALECLRRLILRDRSHPSVIFWLCWNECQFRGTYLERARMLCRELDPARPVSAASHVAPAETKAEFDRVGMDFYTFHPYGMSPERVHTGISIEQALTLLAGKPVIFTEWGGWPVQNNYTTMAEFGRTFIRYARQHAPQPNLAGFSFWEWADMPEPVREPPACHNGVLNEGLVDINRELRPMYPALADIFKALEQGQETPSAAIVTESPIACEPTLRYAPVDLSALHARPEQAALWTLAKERMLEQRRPLVSKIVGPALPRAFDTVGGLPAAIPAGAPLLLGESAPVLEIAIGRKTAALVLLGEVALAGGWPLGGKMDEPAARYVLCYADGSEQQVLLRNGRELASCGTVYLHSRINPLVSGAARALFMQMDADWKEAYQVNYMVIPASADSALVKLKFELLNGAYLPALYGLTLALAGQAG
ncbi:MAG: hypothetical protein LLG44_03835 [Chloroflexi bacterium]|nr:hypothetical protein [Chloroflexota bacterium]